MGDRSLIIIQSDSNPNDIVIYGHWSGRENLQAVRNVLSATSRINDPYLVSELFYEFAVSLGGYSGVGFGSFGIWGMERGADEGWVDAPSVYVNQDTGSYTYEGKETTYDELLAEMGVKSDKEEPQVIYGDTK